ncbi:Rv3654c family TadE-like protein [Amnibacterium endophyticum]|uniref:Rv3654c family TadE-like protein n=1 Tax=Amnibacterium endophyticum TaxID=2109337 RepID=A0ABW4LCM6_9MICO
MKEEGAGSVLGVAVTGAVVAAFVLVAPLAVLLVAAHRAAAAADAAALAAGATALGLAVGVPCERAAEVARSSGAELASCRQHGDLVRVRAVVEALGLPLGADAVAGPSTG